MAADSVTLRVLYKPWGNAETAECNSDDWGWDSVIFRLAAGGRATVIGYGRNAHLQLGRILTSDSAWLAYDPGEMFTNGGVVPRNPPKSDSVVISARPVRFASSSVDAGWSYLIRTVERWPEPVRRPVGTTTLSGKVVDAASGRLIPFARVVVLGTKVGANTDRAGRFALTGVPVGTVRLDACGGCYMKTHLDVRAPSDSVELRLARRPGCSYPD